MTVYSLIRFNVTKADDNTTVICETKNDAATARASMLLVVKYAPEVSISTDPISIYEGKKSIIMKLYICFFFHLVMSSNILLFYQ